MNIPEVAKLICAYELEIDGKNGITKIHPLNKVRLHGFERTAIAIESYIKEGKIISVKWSRT